MPNSSELYLLQQIISNIPAWVWYKSIAGVYTFVNDAFLQGSGLTREQVIGKTDFDLWDSESAIHFVERDRSVMKSKAPIVVCELTPGTHTTPHYLETLKFPVFDENNNVIGICGIAHDKTWESNLVRYVQGSLQELEAMAGG